MMHTEQIFPVLLIAVITRCQCDHTTGFRTRGGNTPSQFGEILKPPPPPHLSSIIPVPFHGGAERNQRQNLDVGYQYQPPPPPPPPSLPLSSDFKFPAPFYKQYNFNFVPPPQSFTTTPSPSLFQKVSGWLFPSEQTSYTGSTVFSSNIAPIKKDCNPCNLVPWLPVIRYNLGNKNVHQNSLPTYGPPSSTAYADSLKVQHHPQPFLQKNNENISPPQLSAQLSGGLPSQNYRPSTSLYSSIPSVSSTYGPPSATHTLDIASANPPSSTFSLPSSYAAPDSSYNLPTSTLGQSTFSYISTPGNFLSSTYAPPSFSYATPSPDYGTPYSMTTPFQPVTPHYEPGVINKDLPRDSDVEILRDIEPLGELQLPKVSHPTTFKNSYGEPITNPHFFEIPYPVSAMAAESSKVKTQVLPNGITSQTRPNVSFALANPAPFTLNRGRNIHTLQPVALPNLSVSPLPPIFNARPFRPLPPQFSTNILQGINQMQQSTNNVNIEPSISLAEFTHSVDYPATIIQSPIIEIGPSTNSNQSKAFRNIPNSYIVDQFRDISSQASEDHISATKTESSFESTGTDINNDLYDTGAPSDIKSIAQVPPNHKPTFADLRGVKDEDIDKYRTENNLQNIDSPLLYLKPSAPHKNYGNFILAVSTIPPETEYEIYDDIPTTTAPQLATSTWDDSRTDYNERVPSPSIQENIYQPKIVQIIVPYTTGIKKPEDNSSFSQSKKDSTSTVREEYQPRKIPSNQDISYASTVTENFNIFSTTTEETVSKISDTYDSEMITTTGGHKDFYDVKEPPFDLIKLQHTIDDWTEQEYSKQYEAPQKTRSSEKYAKQIPDEYFTTTVPTNYVTTSNYNYEFYDHEGSSSIQHTVTNENNSTISKPRKEYNTMERTRNKVEINNSGKKEEFKDGQRLHIYTAASSFRTTSTTPAPWGKIQTSISPLTKEKVYVVTSKPWRESRNITSDWYEIEPFESKKTTTEASLDLKNLPFKSPRFLNRPSFGFTSGGKIETAKSDTSYGFSRSWYQSINELETRAAHQSTSLSEVQQEDPTDFDEDISATTAEFHEHGIVRS